MAKTDMSSWIMPIGILAAAYFAYEYVTKQCAAGASTGFVGTLCGAFSSTPTSPASGLPSLTTLMPIPVTSIPSVPVVPAHPATDPWALAIAALKSAAGNNSENYDQWAWYWQNSAAIPGGPSGYGIPGSLSNAIIGNLITAGGAGDSSNLWSGRGTKITAEQFVSDLKQAEGLSGLARDIGIPAYLIHGGLY